MQVQATLEAIRALLNPKRVAACNDSTLTIKESDKGAALRRVDIVSVGASAFSLEYDKCQFPGVLVFGAHPSLHRACDAIAFCEVDNEPYIFCCELKSTEPKLEEVAEQLRNAECFLTYLDALLQRYPDKYQKTHTITNWPRRYFVFHNQGYAPVPKRSSRDLPDNDAPHKAMFIPYDGTSIKARKLLGKPL
jgi:hypothetical protein